jgi:alpha-galactosidase
VLAPTQVVRRRLVIAAVATSLVIAVLGVIVWRGLPQTRPSAAPSTCDTLYQNYTIPARPAPPANANLAPLGFNPYNFAPDANQQTILAAMRAMTTNGMQAAGYRYINLDDGWQGARDAAGNLQPGPKFDCGIGRLAAFAHAGGYRLGIYTAASAQACGGSPGSAGHVAADVARFAHWGVDLIKLDWCGASYNSDDVRRLLTEWQTAIRSAGRPMVLMANAGGAPVVLSEAANLAGAFRVEGDICAAWTFDPGRRGCFDRRYNLGIRDYIERVPWEAIAGWAKPGHAPDADMLEVGNGLPLAEAQTQFSLWAMWGAPLLAGNDVTAMNGSDIASQVLLNRDIIAIDQDPLGRTARIIAADGAVQYWRKPLADGATLAAVNLGEQPAPAQITLAAADVSGTLTVRDAWTKAVLPPASHYQATIPPHGVWVLTFAR